MIIHSIGDDELDYGDIDRVKELGACEAWYEYHDEGWEGWGNMILRKEDKFGLHDLGHCSCYPPTEDIGLTKYKYATLEDLLADCSEAYAERLKGLVEAVKKS